MKEHPILMSAPMVRAILDGSKTMTRRVVKIGGNAHFGSADPKIHKFDWTRAEVLPNAMLQLVSLGESIFNQIHVPFTFKDDAWEDNAEDDTVTRVYPKWEVGDRLWVKETHLIIGGIDGENPRVIYRAGGNDPTPDDGISNSAEWWIQNGVFRPSIYMPRWASRLTLEITEIRVERVQDITEADAIREGVELDEWTDYIRDQNGEFTGSISYERDWITPFQKLWDSINAKRGHGWDVNPWVWVIGFKRVTV